MGLMLLWWAIPVVRTGLVYQVGLSVKGFAQEADQQQAWLEERFEQIEQELVTAL